MKIYIHQIPVDGLRMEGEDPSSVLDLQDQQWAFNSPIFHCLDATILKDALLVTGRIWTTSRVHCSRCWKEFSHLLEVQQFVFHKPLTGEDIVDLTSEIRENIILEVPQKPLCRENCKGLCPVCGCDRNRQLCHCVQPSAQAEWAELDKLKL